MYIIGSHIITPLGEGVENIFNLIVSADRFCYGSKINIGQSASESRFEKLCIVCAQKAINTAGIDTADKRTVFVISTTKGNIEALEHTNDVNLISPAHSARRIAAYFDNQNTPIIVSNACTSGVCAQIIAMRLLQSGYYNEAVVIGADVLSEFIVSGFNCLKAVSDERCRPYDANRKGLNLGEAVGCMIISNKPRRNCVQLISGSICNDANHISGPSRTGEGSLRVLQAVIQDAEKADLALINAHGTSTLYNDEMESIAVDRAGMADVPLNSLKSIFGHTMGAAGVIETLLTAHALQHGIILPTRNFKSLGVSRPIHVSNEVQPTQKTQFIKLMSGFGGCNAALLYSIIPQDIKQLKLPQLADIARVRLSSDTDDLQAIYRERIKDYPKFFKMDAMSRLGFVATELITQQNKLNPDCAVVIFSCTGSLANDTLYQQTIKNFPSPALFVYTLPNIVTGEIAIRHHLQTETSCYMLDSENWTVINKIIKSTVAATECTQILYGWVEAQTDHFYADMRLAEYRK